MYAFPSRPRAGLTQQRGNDKDNGGALPRATTPPRGRNSLLDGDSAEAREEKKGMTARNATGQQTDRPTGVGSVSRNRLTGMIWEKEELNFFFLFFFPFSLDVGRREQTLAPRSPPPLRGK